MSAQIISLPRWGATPDEWATFDLLLGLTEDLLPVVSNPNAEISPESKMKQVGKTPSKYNGNGKAAGIANWTSHHATSADVERWSRHPDIGICLQTRTVRALDIDIDNAAEAKAVRAVIDCFGMSLPCRMRSNAPKFLVGFTLPGDMQKRVIRTAHGIIEFLATGQQFVACGTHTSGVRYEWEGGLPQDFPEMPIDIFDRMWAMLVENFAVEPVIEGKASTKAQQLQQAASSDPVAQYLLDKGLVLSGERDGRLHITCPWVADHTTASPDSSTSYFPAHTGGYERGHFKCLHAHCTHRTDDEFKDALGVPNTDFDDFDVVDAEETQEGEQPKEEKPPRFAVVPAHEFAAGRPASWLIKGVLPEAALAVVFGDSGSGKTFFIMDMVGAVARGLPWREKRIKQGKCVYIVAEGAAGFRNRLQAYAEHEDIPLEELDIGIIGDAPNFMLVPDVKDVLKAVRAYGQTAIIVVDTFAQVMPGSNENSGEDVGKALAHCKVLHQKTGALVVLIHHSGKDSSKGARGWSGLRAAADCEIEISRVENDRVATVTKLKDGDDGTEFGFKLQTVVLGKDDDGDDITSCVVQHTAVIPKAQRKKEPKGDIQILAWRLFNDLVGLSDGEGVSATTLWDACIAQLPEEDGKRDTRRQRVMRAVDGLIAAGRLRMDGAKLVMNEDKNDD